jgi:dCMP deaminase
MTLTCLAIEKKFRSERKWDLRFLQMAKLVSTFSKDPSTKTGAIIVRPDRTIQSVGFNGFPKGMSDDESLYANRDEKYSRIVHCEINAFIFAGGPVRGNTLYTYPFCSCDRCAVQMIQAGIARFVFPKPSQDALSRWGAAFDKSKKYFQELAIPFSEIEETL